MGVPKFFRWISERYPLINQRCYNPSRHLAERVAAEAAAEAAAAGNRNKSKKKKEGSDSDSDGPEEEDSSDQDNDDKSHLYYHQIQEYFDQDPVAASDPLKSATLPPEIDRLYIDMNGIIHGCSHANNDEEDLEDSVTSQITHAQIFDNVCTYLERIVEDLVQPQELVYLAIDGVAPRAKLNQQRSRRYRSGTGHELEQTVYDAHMDALVAEQQREDEEMLLPVEDDTEAELDSMDPDIILDYNSIIDKPDNHQSRQSGEGTHRSFTHGSSHGKVLTEVQPGRYAGKFETHLGSDEVGDDEADSGASPEAVTKDPTRTDDDDNDEDPPYLFHSNNITPGTPFFQEFAEHMEAWLKEKVAHDPKWQHLTIIFSGSNVPGEGEHKIMDFMRQQRATPDYNPNLRHCIQGQDGDLIMLGLLTHEPNLVLFREQVVFNSHRRPAAFPTPTDRHRQNAAAAMTASGVEEYVHNPNFEFLHMNVLRDYLSFDFETANVVANSPYCLERTIDDFVFMTFFVGNDFLPAMPALDIADEAFDLLWHAYRMHRDKWQKDDTIDEPYLTRAGTIVSGKRLEEFLAEVGSYESPWYDNKKESAEEIKLRIREMDKKYGTDTLPPDEVLKAKEDADRAKFRKMMSSNYGFDVNWDEDERGDDGVESLEEPVRSSEPKNGSSFQPSADRPDQVEEGLTMRLGNLLKQSVLSSATTVADGEEQNGVMAKLDDQDVKGRYYFDKFELTPFDLEEHQALLKAYIEGLVWTLKYYYEGCVSWSWYYPYHYGPMISDLKNIDEMLAEISFDDKLGEPLRPFEQLMSCMPPSQAHVLPKPYRGLMTDKDSPILDFYPRAFTVDMNGKRMPWEAVVLLPFIDTNRLLEHTKGITKDHLTPEEQRRNAIGHAIVISNTALSGEANSEVGSYDNEKFVILSQGDIPDEVVYGKQTGDNKALLHVTKLEDGKVAVPIPQRNDENCKSCVKNLNEQKRYCWNHFRAKDIEAVLPEWSSAPILVQPVQDTQWNQEMKGFEPIIKKDTIVPLPGFSTLRSAPIRSLWRKRIGVDVFGMSSRYKTACLELNETTPKKLPSLEVLGKELIGSTIWINYPHLTEGFVTSVSSETHYMRGKDDIRMHAGGGKHWIDLRDNAVRQLEKGQGVTGTGGLIVSPGQELSLSVRPFQELKDMPHNLKVKTFAKQEITIPIVSALIAPPKGDPRIVGVPALMEKDPYKFRRNGLHIPKGNTKTNVDATSRKGSRNGVRQTRGRQRKPELGHTINGQSGGLATSTLTKSGKEAVSRNFSSLARPCKKKVIMSGIKTQHLPGRSFATTSYIRHETLSSTRAVARSQSSASFGMNPGLMRSKGRMVVGLVAAAIVFASGVNASSLFGNQHYHRANTKVPVPGWQSPQDSSTPTALVDVLAIRGGGNSADFEGRRDSRGMTSHEDATAVPHQYDAGSNVPPLEFAHGTTTLSFVFDGGAIVAVDSRASLGSFVGSKTVQKVLPINSHLLGTMAGGAADCSYLIRWLRSEAQLYELQHQRRMSSARVSSMLANMLYENRGLNLSVGTMIVGYDDQNSKGPKIFYVDNSGARLEGRLFSAGSGSTFALSILDTEVRPNLSLEEAVALGIRAIRYATFRDAFSGGFINVYVITQEEGWRKVFTEDVATTSTLPSAGASTGPL